jgi:hypothetical protein
MSNVFGVLVAFSRRGQEYMLVGVSRSSRIGKESVEY